LCVAGEDLIVRSASVLFGTALACWGSTVATSRSDADAFAVAVARWLPVVIVVLILGALVIRLGEWATVSVVALISLAVACAMLASGKGSWAWFWRSWPGLLVATGVAINLAVVYVRSTRTNSRSDLVVRCFFSRDRVELDARELEAVKVWALFGDVELDLTRAGEHGRGVRVDVRSFAGTLRFRLPSDWDVGFDEAMLVWPSSLQPVGPIDDEASVQVHGVHLVGEILMTQTAVSDTAT
jgi:Cell wall-active antibiotics response 4TMS YvqF